MKFLDSKTPNRDLTQQHINTLQMLLVKRVDQNEDITVTVQALKLLDEIKASPVDKKVVEHVHEHSYNIPVLSAIDSLIRSLIMFGLIVTIGFSSFFILVIMNVNQATICAQKTNRKTSYTNESLYCKTGGLAKSLFFNYQKK